MPRGQLPREDVQVLILKFEMGEVGVEIPFHSLKKAIECLSEKKNGYFAQTYKILSGIPVSEPYESQSWAC